MSRQRHSCCFINGLDRAGKVAVYHQCDPPSSRFYDDRPYVAGLFNGTKVTAGRAFDTKSPKGTLKRFHPDITEVVDVTAVPDQMRIFDTVSDADVTVIDVRAGLLSPTLRALRDVGYLDAVKKDQLSLVVFHSLGASVASLNEIEDTSAFTGDASYFLVKNFINNTSFFEWDQATQSSYFRKVKDAIEVTIPKLNEMAFEQVELAAVPFLTFVANKDPMATPPTTPSFYAATSGTGSEMSGRNTNASSGASSNRDGQPRNHDPGSLKLISSVTDLMSDLLAVSLA